MSIYCFFRKYYFALEYPFTGKFIAETLTVSIRGVHFVHLWKLGFSVWIFHCSQPSFNCFAARNIETDGCTISDEFTIISLSLLVYASEFNLCFWLFLFFPLRYLKRKQNKLALQSMLLLRFSQQGKAPFLTLRSGSMHFMSSESKHTLKHYSDCTSKIKSTLGIQVIYWN